MDSRAPPFWRGGTPGVTQEPFLVGLVWDAGDQTRSAECKASSVLSLFPMAHIFGLSLISLVIATPSETPSQSGRCVPLWPEQSWSCLENRYVGCGQKLSARGRNMLVRAKGKALGSGTLPEPGTTDT